jgi:hypothetical protein
LLRTTWVFLLPAWLGLFAALSGCAGLVTTSNSEIPVTGPDPSYRTVVATHLKQVLKNYSIYEFEISDPRWINSIKGWTWLTCVRLREVVQPGPEQIALDNNPTDRPPPRVQHYALFLDGNKVVDSRFAVQIDSCDLQSYYPLKLWHRPETYRLIFPRKERRSTPARSSSH